MTANSALHLVWLDLEMTGLDPDHDQILEIATLITDQNLQEIAVGPTLTIHCEPARLAAMDDWNRSHHGRSGLTQRALESTISVATAEAQTLAFIRQYVPERSSPICGNSICQDRRFLYRGMPELERYFHYRNLDVSTLKELARRWAPQVLAGVHKRNLHRALEDVRDSIAELRHYRAFMGELGGRFETQP